MNVKNELVKGVFWTTIETIVNRGFGFIIQLFLARLLFPEDYGLVGMASVFIAFINIFNDLGMNAALVQIKKEKLRPVHFDTVFWTGVAWSVFLYLLMVFIGTPLIVKFYNESKLVPIIPIICLNVLISPINMVHRAKLVKTLQFKKLALISNISSITSGIMALLLAFLGYGVWALVFNSIAGTVVSVPMFLKASKWLPKFRWERQAFKDIFSFGAYTTGTSLSNYLMGNLDYLLIGKLLGSVVLGYYSFAFIITNTVRDQIVTIINKVAYPIYASMQDNKKDMLDLFLKIVALNNLVVYPVILGIFLFFEFLIPIFFGHKWDNAIPLVKILSVAVLIQMLNNSHTMLFRAAGAVRVEFGLQLLKTICFYIPLISLGAYYHGAQGAAIGFTIAIFFGIVVSFYFMNKLFGLRIKQTIKALKASLLMLLICWPSTELFKTIMDWKLCIVYYFFAVVSVYLLFGKPQILLIWGIIKQKKLINR